MNESWKIFTWHCSNCGALVQGLKNEKGDIKVECKICHMVMVRKIKSRRHDTIDLYAPKGMTNEITERICG